MDGRKTEEYRQLQREAAFRRSTKEYRQLQREAAFRRNTEEYRQLQRTLALNRPPISEITRQKIRETSLGRFVSEETKNKKREIRFRSNPLYPLNVDYPRHFHHFIRMIGRIKGKLSHLDHDFKQTKSDFYLFVETIGSIPIEMARPSVGRKDHTKGYVLDNFAWQELLDNARLQNNRWQ